MSFLENCFTNTQLMQTGVFLYQLINKSKFVIQLYHDLFM